MIDLCLKWYFSCHLISLSLQNPQCKICQGQVYLTPKRLKACLLVVQLMILKQPSLLTCWVLCHVPFLNQLDFHINKLVLGYSLMTSQIVSHYLICSIMYASGSCFLHGISCCMQSTWSIFIEITLSLVLSPSISRLM